LHRVGRLGVGAFGLVTLEMDRNTGQTYALKAVSKGYLQSLKMEKSVLNEKFILKMVDSPFVVRLVTTYRGIEHVYFLLEAVLGGELFTTYENLQLYGSENHAMFYVACVVEAFAHLHLRNVVYRDLKPENLLLDARGYCKIADFGLAKVIQGPTFTLVGTPDYMAPEVIKRSGHGRAVDWWMLGVLLFELLVGHAPFEAPSADETYERVKLGIERVSFSSKFPSHAKALVRALCQDKPAKRPRAEEVMRAPWLAGFDWQSLRALRLPPPYVPKVRGAHDVSNFRKSEGEDPPVLHYVDDGSGWDLGFDEDALHNECPPVGGASRATTLCSTGAICHGGRPQNFAADGARAVGGG
jgi:cGMP-dependent protein kinase